MQTFAASALFLSTLLVPAFAQYGGSGSSSTASASVAAAATTTASGSTPTHTVQVGANGFVFTPDSVTAAKGDILEFHYTGSSLHDVVQGSFSKPCSNNDGVFSGYPSTSDVFQVMVNSTDPMWMYCSTLGHCQGGMAMVVNQGSGSNTLAAYKSAAKGTSSSNAPASAQGGTVIAISALSQSSSSSSSMSGSGSSTMSAATSSSTSASGAAETMSNTFKKFALAIGIPVLAWLMD